MVFDYSYNLTALIFLVVLTIHYQISPFFPNRANKLFSAILIEASLSVILDIFTFYCINNKVNMYLNYTVNILFFLAHWIIPYLLLRFLIVLTKHEFKVHALTKYLPVIIIVINYSLLITTPFTHYIFYIDDQLNYVRGSMFVFAIALELIILFWGVLFAIVKRKDLTVYQLIIIPFYIIITTFAAVIQYIFPGTSIISASVCLAIFLMYITLLNPTEYLDTMSNLYNRMAFNEYIYTLITKKTPFNFIIIDIEGTTRINRILSENVGNQVIRNIGNELYTLKKHCMMFRIEGDRFVLISKKEKTKKLILEQLKSKFPLTITNLDITLEIDVHIAYSDLLTDIESTSEIIDLINFICRKAKENAEISRLNLENINEFRYNKARNIAITKAIENEEIELNLQPIYDTKNKQFNSAEALCRINTKQFGYINPSIFIPFAERKGIISQLSLTMIRKVCEFLNSVELPNDFKNISINLSVIDCLDPTFPNKIIELLDHFNINNKQIIFEVTESTASVAPQLEQTMCRLIEKGISFSMDDFGTGYANLDSVLRLPFSVAKIDKGLLLLAQESNKYKVMISSLIEMIKNLDLEIVVEGIETIDQLKFLSDMKVDYYQGYYYCKPIPTCEFKDFILKNN